jgi:hypothetical protein
MDAEKGDRVAVNLNPIYSAARAKAAANDAGIERGEHVVTVVAVMLAVLVVAAIAVLMGMG